MFLQVACRSLADTREVEAVNYVIKHQTERAGFRGSLSFTPDRVLNAEAAHLGEGSTPKWSELEPHVARARAEATIGFPSHEESYTIDGRFAPVTDTSHACSMTILQDACVALPSTSVLPAARAYDISTNPWNAVKVLQAIDRLDRFD